LNVYRRISALFCCGSVERIVNVRTEFISLHEGTSGPTINNIISKLKKKNIFIKENGKVKVNPKIVLDFKNNIIINISLQHEI